MRCRRRRRLRGGTGTTSRRRGSSAAGSERPRHLGRPSRSQGRAGPGLNAPGGSDDYRDVPSAPLRAWVKSWYDITWLLDGAEMCTGAP